MTAAEYAQIAPLLSKAVGVTKFKTDNPAPAEAIEVVPVQPTIAKVGEVYELLRDVEGNGGHLGVARATGVSLEWVRQIHEEMRRAMVTHYGVNE